MTEQQPYEVVQSYPRFELRHYPPHVIAEVSVHGSFEEAGNRAFRALFGYITGQNESARSVAMASPVVQEKARSEKIAMTARSLRPRLPRAITSSLSCFLHH